MRSREHVVTQRHTNYRCNAVHELEAMVIFPCKLDACSSRLCNGVTHFMYRCANMDKTIEMSLAGS